MNDRTQTLKALSAQAQARWSALAPREQRLVRAMACLLGLTLLVMVGVRPALKTLAAAPGQLAEVNAVLDDMGRLAEETKALRQVAPVPPGTAEGALRAATERLGPVAKLTVQPDRVVVAFDKVEGARLAEWLVEVRVGARARPLEANLAQSAPGQYSGNVVLALSGNTAAR